MKRLSRLRSDAGTLKLAREAILAILGASILINLPACTREVDSNEENSADGRIEFAMKIGTNSPKYCFKAWDKSGKAGRVCNPVWGLTPTEEPFPVANIYNYAVDYTTMAEGKTDNVCRMFRGGFIVDFGRDSLAEIKRRGFRMIRFINNGHSVECSVD